MKKNFLHTEKLMMTILGLALAMALTTEVKSQNQLGGHFGVVQPIATLNDGDINDEFDPHTLGFPIGVTVRKSENFAFDAEFVPLITFGATTINDDSADPDELDRIILLVHPGFLFGIGEGLTFGTRLAYELGDSGRYGFTPLLNKGFKIGNTPVFAEIVFPVRMGSDQGFSLTGGLHLGVGF